MTKDTRAVRARLSAYHDLAETMRGLEADLRWGLTDSLRIPQAWREIATRPDVPHEKRMAVARLMEDLTASDEAGWYSVISLHGGGSPEAMKREIYRYYPVEERVALVERLMDRGVLADDGARPDRQPGRCCPVGCQVPETPQLDFRPDAPRDAPSVTPKDAAE